MDLIKIQNWLNEYFEDNSDDILGHLEEIHTQSYNYLQSINQKFEYPYNDDGLWHLYVHSEITYKTRTIEGYHCSWIRSEQLLETEDYRDHLLREWKDDLDKCLDDNRKRHKAARTIHIYWLQNQSEDQVISDEEYTIARKDLYNKIAHFIYDFYEFKDVNDDLDVITAEECEELINILSFVDSKVGLDKVYPKDFYLWVPFYYSKMVIEKINRDLNKHGGGRKPKMQRDLGISEKQFCIDLNKCIEAERGERYINDNVINTYQLAGYLLEKNEVTGSKYVTYYDQDSLNKYIKTIFESAWLEHDDLMLFPLFKYDSQYYLINEEQYEKWFTENSE